MPDGLDRIVRDHAATLRSMEERLKGAEQLAAEADRFRAERDEAVEQLDRLEQALERAEVVAARCDEQLRRVRESRAWKLVTAYRRLRSQLAPDLTGDTDRTKDESDALADSPAPRPAAVDGPNVDRDDPPSMVRFRGDLDAWAKHAASAPGDDVVVMFSGTTFVQEHRGNRPIRLTNVYLERRSPVFFSYYRFDTAQPLPEHSDDLLFQSPIDVTAKVLPDVFGRDFGDRRKVFYVSFPHRDAVRLMSLARAHGWTIVYDIRDDWEAFQEVGAAHWFDPALERWTVQAADIVTAVSEPLAEKLRVDTGRTDITISPNALDRSFPRRPGRPGPDERRVGYFGHLQGQWFDWQLIREAAQALPEWSFELAGHGAPTDAEVLENLHLLGPLSRAELAERSSQWAGGLIPFTHGPITDPLDPIKVYEYIHLRLPTVAGYYPPIRTYPGVELCESIADTIEAIRRLPDRRVDDEEAEAFLAGNHWHDRVDQYSQLIDDLGHHGGVRGSFDAYLRPPGQQELP